MIFDIILLVIGLILLVKFSSVTIQNAVKLSRLTGVSEMTIGFILIAVSTSIPELTIAIISSLRGEGLLSFGNLVGANISNLALIFGILGLIGFAIKKKDLIEIYEAVLLTSVVAVFAIALRRIDLAFGVFLLIVFYVFAKGAIKSGINGKGKFSGLETIEITKAIFYVIVSVAVVIISAKIVTDSSIGLAQSLGIAESLIGATILALGTSLPELSVGIMAIRKGNVGLAVGDGLGSIVANLTLVLGIAALIHPMDIGFSQVSLLWMLLIVNCIFILLASRLKFGKKEGAALLAIYILYLLIVVNTG